MDNLKNERKSAKMFNFVEDKRMYSYNIVITIIGKNYDT